MAYETKNNKEENEEVNQQDINRVQMTFDLTHDKMLEVVLVGGPDESCKSPETFKAAWNHKISYLRGKQREAISGEKQRMEGYFKK